MGGKSSKQQTREKEPSKKWHWGLNKRKNSQQETRDGTINSSYSKYAAQNGDSFMDDGNYVGLPDKAYEVYYTRHGDDYNDNLSTRNVNIKRPITGHQECYSQQSNYNNVNVDKNSTIDIAENIASNDKPPSLSNVYNDGGPLLNYCSENIAHSALLSRHSLLNDAFSGECLLNSANNNISNSHYTRWGNSNHSRDVGPWASTSNYDLKDYENYPRGARSGDVNFSNEHLCETIVNGKTRNVCESDEVQFHNIYERGDIESSDSEQSSDNHLGTNEEDEIEFINDTVKGESLSQADDLFDVLDILAFPSEWSSCSLKKNGYVDISFLSPEGSALLKYFNSTAQSKDFKLQITGITRIENPFLHSMYLLKKEEMKFRNGHVDELYLYHGTKKEHLSEICEDNLNWRIVERHKFGQGVSFSPLATYSSHYSDNTVIKVMLLFKVLVSNSTYGSPDLIIPQDENGHTCDASIKEDATVIVKYSDYEFYPLYKILYTKWTSASKKFSDGRSSFQAAGNTLLGQGLQRNW